MRHRVTSRSRPTNSKHAVVARPRLSSDLIAGATIMLAALMILPAPGRTATVWLDSDGDGLPQQGGLLAVSNGANLTLDVWINSGSFQWTNYLLYIEWDGCIDISDPEYVVSGGTNFGIDDFSKPSTVGFGGTGFSQHGTDLIARVKLAVSSPNGCCVRPITEVDEEYGAFCQLGSAPEAYRLFDDTDGLCFESLDSRRDKSWGGVKGLYK